MSSLDCSLGTTFPTGNIRSSGSNVGQNFPRSQYSESSFLSCSEIVGSFRLKYVGVDLVGDFLSEYNRMVQNSLYVVESVDFGHFDTHFGSGNFDSFDDIRNFADFVGFYNGYKFLHCSHILHRLYSIQEDYELLRLWNFR